MLFDSHAHLADKSFEADLEQVLERAYQAGVDHILLVGETMTDARRNLELAGQYPLLKAAAGLYPGYAEIEAATTLADFIRDNAAQFHAIGEVGLDFWLAKEAEQRSLQEEVFSIFIRLAKELDLPLNVHSRSAGRQTIDLLLKEDARRVQMHGYGGKASSALPGVEAGYLFSVPPSIVHSRQKQKLIGHLPLNSLLLESDSPVLGPIPDKRNEPANIIIALETIAAIKHVEKEAVREAVTRNGVRLYPNIFS